MLDYVKRSELDAERSLRIRAEAERDTYQRANETLLNIIVSQSQQHCDEIATLLKHTAPIASSDPIESGLSPATKAPTTVEEAMWMPANTRDQIWAKRDEIARLQRAAGQTAPKEPLDDELTDVERERVAQI